MPQLSGSPPVPPFHGAEAAGDGVEVGGGEGAVAVADLQGGEVVAQPVTRSTRTNERRMGRDLTDSAWVWCRA